MTVRSFKKLAMSISLDGGNDVRSYSLKLESLHHAWLFYSSLVKEYKLKQKLQEILFFEFKMHLIVLFKFMLKAFLV